MKKYALKDLAPPTPPLFKIDYEKELNAVQWEAVTIREGPVLVIAGAGSGKTRTLVYRLARLVETGVPPEKILLLTFTRKAAQEMLRRASMMIGSHCERIRGGTFHAVANIFLRKYALLIGYESTFTILDRSDSEEVINLVRAQQGLNEKRHRFPRKNTIAEIFSKANNLMKPLSYVVERDYFHFHDDLEELVSLQGRYQEYKRRNQLMDYDDLLIHFRDLLENSIEVRADISQQFRYIMVDEFQDTNLPQAEIIRLMAFSHNNVMVVGDDSQSIYSFRGANFRNIMDFPKQFPESRVITLEENYRSTQPILNVTNVIIGNAKDKYDKNLYTRKNRGPLPVILAAENENYQSRFIVQKILELREEGTPLNDMAVLCRAAFHTFDLEIELGRFNIPYVKYGGFKFIETAHVKDVLAHLRLVRNPRDGMSWSRVLMLVEKVGPQTSRNIVGWIQKNQGGDALLTFSQKGKFTESLRRLHTLLESLSRDGLTVADQISLVCRYYEPILKKRYDDYPRRLKDLEHLQAITERYQSLERFLNDIALEPPNESVAGVTPPDSDDERLVLSTIHSAKGLEWNTVFIIWALEGKFPSSYAFNSDDEMEEERRLMYVAATRAKENLFITYPIRIYDRVSGTTFSEPSRFIKDLPSELVQHWGVIESDDCQSFRY
ncbi:MAG: ATP-dependent helicase [Deltaproteobacteria bacterium]|nr:ATP-dependent helicase [Deltaproteobacteria bacterium]